jgi:hypothetical protein
MSNRLSDECIWGAGEATKSANKSNHSFFFLFFLEKNPCHLLVLFRSMFDGLFTHR